MPFSVTVERTRDCVRFDVAGAPSIKNYFDLIEVVVKKTLERGDKFVLVDLRRVTGRLSFTDQFFIGDVVGQKLAHLARLATLVADDPDSHTSSKVATRKGLNFRTFAGEEEAIGWLTQGPCEPAP
jgi:hypothetical protein